MQKVKFTYDTPMIGEFINDGPDMSIDSIIYEIEQDFPEATGIEIIEIVNG